MGNSVLINGLQTMIDKGKPTKNYDTQTISPIRKSTTDQTWLLYFSRPFPLGATIISAQVVMYSAATSQTGTLTLTAKRIKTAVSMSKVTWNSRPTTYYTGTATATRTGPVANKAIWTLDVTSMMQAVSAGDAWFGWEISSSVLTPALNFYTPTYADSSLVPRLEVVWSDAPDQPRTLSPAGGRAISVTKPVVRCDYVDVSGLTDIASIQVQTNASNVWTAPTFDSGEVAVSVPELDLAATAFPAITDGASVWWRVRVKDAAGLWSAWSDGANFVRDAKGTLTVTSPAVSPNNFVSETTPPIIWTFTGETQSAFQVDVTRTSAGGQQKLWSSGRITSTATSYTLPEGVLVSPDDAYSLSLKVWDTDNRESIAGDPAYVEVVQPFTFTLDATTSPVTGLTTSWLSPYPKIQVAFSRSTAPDSFTIMRNRQVIATDVDPASIFVSGTSYAYIDPSPSPNIVNLYEVMAVVNTKASATNPTSSITMKTQGIWLADLARVNEVLITGKADRTFVWGEQSEVLEPIGATEVVLITTGMRGAEGNITGQLHSNVLNSNTAQQWRDALLAIKAKPGRRCWLSVGDATMSVVIRNVNISPRPTAQLAFDVSFDFYQVGTLPFVPTL